MVIANGCQTDVLTQAEDMIQAYEFETAIELLDSLDISKKSEGRLRLLRAKAHLISGDRGFAYAELKFHDDNHSNSTTQLCARLFLTTKLLNVGLDSWHLIPPPLLPPLPLSSSATPF